MFSDESLVRYTLKVRYNAYLTIYVHLLQFYVSLVLEYYLKT